MLHFPPQYPLSSITFHHELSEFIIQLLLVNDPTIEPVTFDPLHQVSATQLTLTWPITQLNDSTSLKEDGKLVTNPNDQVEPPQSSLVPVEEAHITKMVEEQKVDEPELTGPSALPSVVSESSPLVSVQLIDSLLRHKMR